MRISITLILIILFSGFLITGEVKARAEDNVFGWAWSENIGWISFNCYNDYGFGMEGHCIADGYASNYGVNIDPITGKFSGYAWAGGGEDTYSGTEVPTIGWIELDPAGPYPEAPYYSAELDLDTNEVSGWARALAYGDGWDGWIKLKGIAQDLSPYGIQLDIISEEFQDWAWGDLVVGWISFNDKNFDGSSGLFDYQVITDLNPPPSATDLKVVEDDYCGAPNPPIYLNWTFDDPGDSQSAYQIQIDNSGAGFPSPEVDTGKVLTPGSGPDYSYAPMGLSFGTQYWWRLKVWDDEDKPSVGWIYPVPATFTTDSRYPNVDFTWYPDEPLVDETIQFCSIDDGINCFNDLTKCYTSGKNPVLTSCSSWAWDFGDGSSIGENPTHSYPSAEDYYIVELTINGICSKQSLPLAPKMPLPTWKEIAPF